MRSVVRVATARGRRRAHSVDGHRVDDAVAVNVQNRSPKIAWCKSSATAVDDAGRRFLRLATI